MRQIYRLRSQLCKELQKQKNKNSIDDFKWSTYSAFLNMRTCVSVCVCVCVCVCVLVSIQVMFLLEFNSLKLKKMCSSASSCFWLRFNILCFFFFQLQMFLQLLQFTIQLRLFLFIFYCTVRFRICGPHFFKNLPCKLSITASICICICILLCKTRKMVMWYRKVSSIINSNNDYFEQDLRGSIYNDRNMFHTCTKVLEMIILK